MASYFHNAARESRLQDDMYSCMAINSSAVETFCSNATLPAKTCVTGDTYNYHKTEKLFRKQAASCSSHKKEAKQCDNDASACKVLSFQEYCGVYDQPCRKAEDCLGFCYSDCYPCNDKSDCDTLVAFGLVAEPGKPCFSVYNHTG